MRIAIEALAPSVPGGNLAVKRLVGEQVTATADIIADGHEVLAAEFSGAPMTKRAGTASQCTRS